MPLIGHNLSEFFFVFPIFMVFARSSYKDSDSIYMQYQFEVSITIYFLVMQITYIQTNWNTEYKVIFGLRTVQERANSLEYQFLKIDSKTMLSLSHTEDKVN